MPTDNSLVLLLHSNFISKSNLVGGFSIRFNDNSQTAFYWFTLFIKYKVKLYGENFCLFHKIFRTTILYIQLVGLLFEILAFIVIKFLRKL